MSNITIYLSICLCLLIPFTVQTLPILETQVFPFMQNEKVVGTAYPEWIEYIDKPSSTIFIFTNITSGKTWINFTIEKNVPFACEYALNEIDYGYYAKFPFYSLIGDCRNSTSRYMVTVNLYRSGEHEVIEGTVQTLSTSERECKLSGLKVQNYYSASGSQSSAVYRLCVGKTHGSVLYKFRPRAKVVDIFDSNYFETHTGLKNISL